MNTLLALCLLGQALTEKSYDQTRAHILPSRTELEWREVGWLPTLWEGLAQAQREDKPILLLAMNGHPLACT